MPPTDSARDDRHRSPGAPPVPLDVAVPTPGGPAVSASTGLAERLGISFVEIGVHRLVARMPVAGNTQPYGLLHGGANCVLAETLGSIGAALHAAPDRLAVGTEINATHHRSASAGYVTGVATPLHLGRRLATYEIVICDDRDRRVCTARLTCTLLPSAAATGQPPAAATPQPPGTAAEDRPPAAG